MQILDDSAVNVIEASYKDTHTNGTPGRDLIKGHDFGSVVDARGGDDTVHGGLRGDSLYGAEGDDVLNGHEDDDTLSGGAGDDVIDGGPGRDRLIGGPGRDRLEGGEDNDIFGLVSHGDGGDTLTGGAGSDVYEVHAVPGAVDRITDFATGPGGDRLALLFVSRLPGFEIGKDDPFTSGHVRLEADGADTLLQVDQGEDGWETVLLLENTAPGDFTPENLGLNPPDAVTRIVGTERDDEMLALGRPTVVDALGGDDFVMGLSGSDTINGGDGDDELYGDDADLSRIGDDRLNGGDGDDRLMGGPGNDTLDGGAGIDTAEYSSGGRVGGVRVDLEAGIATSAGHGVDTLIDIERVIGTPENDTLIGSAGDDILEGWVGDDEIFGGDGDDVLLAWGGASLLDGGDGLDTVDYSGTFYSVAVRLASGTATGNPPIHIGAHTLVSIETVRGGQADDSIIGDAAANLLLGNRGDDYLEGGKNDDTLLGGAGNDTLRGALDHDWLEGGAGLDHLHGDSGNDTLLGGDNNDRLVGGAGNDRLEGGGGADELQGESGKDMLIGDRAGLSSPFFFTTALMIMGLAVISWLWYGPGNANAGAQGERQE